MRSWLTYIFLSMATCGALLTSCSNVLDEEGIVACDDRAPVRLTISFGESTPMSRDVNAGTDGTVPELDYTTDLQKAMDADDVYLLVFDAQTGFLKYQVKDFILSDPTDDDYNTRTLSGTMLKTATGQKVKLVVLANLIQNNITVPSTNSTDLSLDSKQKVQDFIDGMIGENQTTIYEKLIYNYNVTNNGTEGIWDISERRIPMWGITVETEVPPTTGVTLDCYLYRAVAKVQIWVNMKNGIAGTTTDDDFKITKITVQNANNQGYCVHVAENQPTTETQYTQPKVPTSVETQDIVYNVVDEDSNGDKENDAREAFSDMIYLPEQSNTAKGATPVKLLVEYTYNGKAYTGEEAGLIEFIDSETQKPFDVIRNHSYIFNIASVNTAEDVKATLKYQVIDWTSVNNPTLNFGNGEGNVTQ